MTTPIITGQKCLSAFCLKNHFVTAADIDDSITRNGYASVSHKMGDMLKGKICGVIARSGPCCGDYLVLADVDHATT